LKLSLYHERLSIIRRFRSTCNGIRSLDRISQEDIYVLDDIKTLFNKEIGNLISQLFIKNQLRVNMLYIMKTSNNYEEVRNKNEESCKISAEIVELLDAIMDSIKKQTNLSINI
ncbi:MAG: hypothetical protein ACKOUM_04460, partial [Sphingopyxis sp.]